MLTPELIREARRLRLRSRRRVDNLLSGEYHTAFKGQGIEFAEVREYQPGDEVRAIDWNVTARTGRPFIKRFSEERQLTVVLAVDQSASGRFGTVGKLKSRLAIEIAAVLTLAAGRNSDRVGLALFSGGVDRFIPPSRGPAHASRIVADLAASTPTADTTDIASTLTYLSKVLTRRAVVFILSDFLSPPFDTPLRVLCARHQVVAVTLTDPRDMDLPDIGLADFIDPETGRSAVIDTSSRRARAAYHGAAVARQEALSRTLARCGADRIDARTDRPFVPQLLRYFQSKEKRR